LRTGRSAQLLYETKNRKATGQGYENHEGYRDPELHGSAGDSFKWNTFHDAARNE
jgi:hypothetical protein